MSTEATPAQVTLSSSFGDVTVTDGDLSTVDARLAFSTGLCGDLAIAVHAINNAPIFFICDSDVTQEEFNAECGESMEYLFDYVMHVVNGSHRADHYVDAFGQASTEQVIRFYAQIGADVHILEGTPEQALYYSAHRDVNLYRNFAAAAIRMDEQNELYAQELTFA